MPRHGQVQPSLTLPIFQRLAAFSGKILEVTMLGKTTKAASLCIWDFTQGFSDSESWEFNVHSTIQLSLSWRKAGISVLDDKPRTQLPGVYKSRSDIFSLLCPHETDQSLHMDIDSHHAVKSKGSLKNKTLLIATSHCPTQGLTPLTSELSEDAASISSSL